jgi:transposase
VGRDARAPPESQRDGTGAPAPRLAAKKKVLYASEQDPVARAAWQAEMSPRDAVPFVFLDETSTATNLTRRYARAQGGARAFGYAPRNYGRRTTLLAALTPAGLTAPMLLEGAVDTAAFVAYLAQVLVPTLQPGQCVILDNLSCHRAAAARQLVEAAGCTLQLLPTYSPDFNPIELAFAKLKTALRAAAARTQAALDAAIHAALEAITPTDAHGWFHHCGYSLARSTP